MMTEKKEQRRLSLQGLLDEYTIKVIQSTKTLFESERELLREKKSQKKKLFKKLVQEAKEVYSIILEVQTAMLIENTFRIFKIQKFSRKSPGYCLTFPSAKKNENFLSFLSKKIEKNTAKGIVVCALGFGNRDSEFPRAVKAVHIYKLALERAGVRSKEAIFNSKIIVDRGAYLFVPHKSIDQIV